MTDDTKEMKIKFTPRGLQSLNELLLDADEEEVKELQEMLDEFKRMAKDGTLLEKSTPVDMEKLRREEPEVYEQVMESLAEIEEEDYEVLESLAAAKEKKDDKVP